MRPRRRRAPVLPAGVRLHRIEGKDGYAVMLDGAYVGDVVAVSVSRINGTGRWIFEREWENAVDGLSHTTRARAVEWLLRTKGLS